MYNPKDYTREELKTMEICAYCRKQLVIKSIVAITNLKSKDIEDGLHLSKSIVSRHLRGEINKPEIDIFVVEHLLGIKIEGYKLTNEKSNK